MTKPPIDPLEICTLDAEQLAERKRWVRREILCHAVGRLRLADGVAIEITDVPGLGERIDEWIELEGDCCGGVRFERRPSPVAGRVRVEIHGVDPEGRLFDEVPLLLVERDRPSPGAALRVLRAGGLGAAASVFVLCVLPMLVVGLVGATAATWPLSRLDDPRWIGLGTIASTGLILWWMNRRRRVCDE